MADYLGWAQLPNFTDEEWEKKKAEYVAEHGYTITFPQIGDIIHLGGIAPTADAEKKARSKEKYESMLASPIPNWMSNYTSVLTAWDNVQDMTITLAAIGRIAIKFLPRIIAGWLAWPIGLLWLIASIMGTIAAPSMCILNPLACKRKMKKELARRRKMLKARGLPAESGTDAWKAIQKNKLKYGFKGYAKSGNYLPSFSEAIQAAQVTNDIWGIGLSIGPIFGLAYDLMFGGVRWLAGQEVTFKTNPLDIEIFQKAGDTKYYYARWKRPKAGMSQAEFLTWKDGMIATGEWGIKSKQEESIHRAMRQSQTVFGFPHRTDWQLEAALYCSAEIAGQGVRNILEHWNPMENVEGLEHIEIEAYNEPNPLIEEMLREEGLDPEKGIAWPQLGKRWATYEEIQTSLAPVAAENFEYFCENCKDEDLKAVMENSAIEFGLHNIAELEGPESIEIQYHAALDIGETLLNHNYSFPLSITEDQIIDFAWWAQACEETNTRPGLREILAYAKNSLGFEFTTERIPLEDR